MKSKSDGKYNIFITSLLYKVVQCSLFSVHLCKCRYVGEGDVNCNKAEKVCEDEKRIGADSGVCCQIFSEDQSERFAPNRRADIVTGS